MVHELLEEAINYLTPFFGRREFRSSELVSSELEMVFKAELNHAVGECQARWHAGHYAGLALVRAHNEGKFGEDPARNRFFQEIGGYWSAFLYHGFSCGNDCMRPQQNLIPEEFRNMVGNADDLKTTFMSSILLSFVEQPVGYVLAKRFRGQRLDEYAHMTAEQARNFLCAETPLEALGGR